MPTGAQFAKHGAWEEAWSFPCQKLPDNTALHAYLARSSEIAFEVFFGEAFFGIRLRSDPLSVENFASICLRALGQASDGGQFFSILSRSANLDGLGQRMSFAEIGTVKAWRTVGTFRIADLQVASVNFGMLWSAVNASTLARDVSHRKAIEFAFATPILHWFALPVSASEPPYPLSAEMLREALSSAINFSGHGALNEKRRNSLSFLLYS
jgi:hypothetical protein